MESLEDGSRLVHDTGGDLGPADVDPDTQRRGGAGPGWGLARVLPGAGRATTGDAQPSTRRLRPLRAPSMIVFSAFRRNMPIIGMFTSTVRL